MRTACKPDSVPGRLSAAPFDDHSSGPAVAGGIWLPTRTPGLRRPCGPVPRGLRPRLRAPRGVPIRHCSGWGLPCRPGCPVRGGLLPHRFTIARAKRARAVSSLWRFPSGCPGRALPGTLASWSPDFPRGRRHPRGHPAVRTKAGLEPVRLLVNLAFALKDSQRGTVPFRNLPRVVESDEPVSVAGMIGLWQEDDQRDAQCHVFDLHVLLVEGAEMSEIPK